MTFLLWEVDELLVATLWAVESGILILLGKSQ